MHTTNMIVNTTLELLATSRYYYLVVCCCAGCSVIDEIYSNVVACSVKKLTTDLIVVS